MTFNPRVEVVRELRPTHVALVDLFVQPPFEQNCFDSTTGLHRALGALLTEKTLATHDAVTVAYNAGVSAPFGQASLSTNERPTPVGQHLTMTIYHGIAPNDSRIAGIVDHAVGLVGAYHAALCDGDAEALRQVLNSEPYQP